MSNMYRANNNNISLQFKERNAFIKEFNRKKIYENQNHCTTTPNNSKINSENKNRWNYLYNLNKVQNLQKKEKREKQRLLTEEKELKECTFIPKLNKNDDISYIYSKNNSNYNKEEKMSKNNSFINLNLFQRQKLWIEKKNKDIIGKKNKKYTEEMEECYFSPEINDKNAINKAKFKKKTINLIEDPESYAMYIKRLKKKREQSNKEKNEDKFKPGSGNLWDKINRGSKGNRGNNNKFNCEYNIRTNKSKNELLDKNKLYEDLYKRNIKRLNNPYGKGIEYDGIYKNNKMNKVEKDDIIYNKPIEYGKAIKILHDKLYDINLESDDDCDKDYIF